MDPKEQTAAANALVEWFNSQEIGSANALSVMQRVIAKILISRAADTIEARKRFDSFALDLANRINDRAFQVIHGKRESK